MGPSIINFGPELQLKPASVPWTSLKHHQHSPFVEENSVLHQYARIGMAHIVMPNYSPESHLHVTRLKIPGICDAVEPQHHLMKGATLLAVIPPELPAPTTSPWCTAFDLFTSP